MRTLFINLHFRVFLFILFTSPVSGQIGLENDYADFLAKQNLNKEEQFEALKVYLMTSRQCERAYLDFLELSFSLNKNNAAKVFFDRLLEDDPNNYYAHWMLAEYARAEQDHETALRSYQEAIHLGISTIWFYYNFSRLVMIRDDWVQDVSALGQSAKQDFIFSAFLHFWRSNRTQALRFFEQYEQVNSATPLLCYFEGLCCLSLGRKKDATALFENGIKLAKQGSDLWGHSLLLTGLAKCYGGRREKAKRDQYLEQALAIANKIHSFYLQQWCLGERGSQALLDQDFRKATQDLTEAIALAQKLKLHADLPRLFRSQGQALLGLNEISASLSAFNQAEFFAAMFNLRNIQIRVMINKIYLFTNIGLERLADNELSRANALWTENKNELWKVTQARALQNFENKNLDAAFRQYATLIEKSDPYTRKDKLAYWHLMVGEILIEQEKITQARVSATKALEIAKDAGVEVYEAYAKLQLAELNEQVGDYERALMGYDDAIVVEYAYKDFDFRSDRLLGMGRAYLKLNQTEKALVHFSAAIREIEKFVTELDVDAFRTGAFREGQHFKAYQEAITAYSKALKKTESDTYFNKLFDYVVASKGRSYQPLKGNGDKRASDAYERAHVNIQKLQRRIRDNPFMQDSLSIELEIARFQLLNAKLESHKSEARMLFPKLEDLKKWTARNKTGLLLYHISDSASFALVVQDSESVYVPLAMSKSEIEAAVESLMLPFHGISQATFDATVYWADLAFQLYQGLFAPIEKKLQLNRKLVIVPDVAIAPLPLAMLLRDRASRREYYPADVQDYGEDLLVQRHAFIYTAGLTFTEDIRSKESGSNSILIVANPYTPLLQRAPNTSRLLTMRGGWQGNILWSAEVEADRIQELHENTTIIKRESATKARFVEQIGEYPYIHFAGHAFVDTAFSAFSGLVFATTDDSTDDGLLMGYEIADLDLSNCELLTLSGCETGRGEYIAAAGILGLPELFRQAGAKKVLMTHWKISDLTSSVLMPRFYEGFLKNGLAKSEALQQAKLSLLNSSPNNSHHKHPAHWAAYTLYGQPDITLKPRISMIAIIMVGGLVIIVAIIVARRRVRFMQKYKLSR